QRPMFIAPPSSLRYSNRCPREKAVWSPKLAFMESRSSGPEKLLAAVTAFEKVVELAEQLCQGGESLARLLGVFFAMKAAFAIRCSLPVGEGDLAEMATNAEQQSLPTLDAVRAAIPKLVAAVNSNNSAATASALKEMGVLSLCPIPAEQLSKME